MITTTLSVVIVLTILGLWIRFQLKPVNEALFKLDPFELALLSGGRDCALYAAIQSLCARGVLLKSRYGILRAVAPIPPEVHPIETAVYKLVVAGEKQEACVEDAADAIVRLARVYELGLLERGLLDSSLSIYRRRVLYILASLPLLVRSVMACGSSFSPRWGDIAIAALMTAFITWMVSMCSSPRTTWLGSKLLHAKRLANLNLLVVFQKNRRTLSPEDIALVIALKAMAYPAQSDGLRHVMTCLIRA